MDTRIQTAPAVDATNGKAARQPAGAQPAAERVELIPAPRHLTVRVSPEGVQRRFARMPSTLVLQPTTLCNLNCAYCYLPERAKKRDMPIEVACAVANGIAYEWTAEGPLDVVWHGGEPLTLGPDALVRLMEPFEALRKAGCIQHVIQTNATLVTDEWCEVFTAYDVAIGVSIDGPKVANSNRVDWRGAPAFERIVAGIDTLTRNGIAFTAIAVVGREQAGQAKSILDFLAAIGCSHAGVNIEELEGINSHAGTPHMADARRFWRDTVEWAHDNEHMTVREVEEVIGFLSLGAADRQADTEHDLIPTIGWNGDVVMLSPELLGTHAPAYDDFVAGNVRIELLHEIVNRAHGLRYVQEFATGIENCKATCEFFSLCQGSHAGNRYFEHRSFTATETQHCKTSTQALVLAMADLTNGRDSLK